MISGRTCAPVVVGVDDVGSTDAAVEWAAAEAGARGCPLRIVHAFHPPLPADPYGVIPPLDGLCTVRAAAESVLRESTARARSVASDIEVSARLLCGTAVPALLHEADRARLLVLGSRGLRGLHALLARSVSIRVAAHARCPVIVVQPSSEAAGSRWSPPRVVVGVDGDTSCSPAVGFAFHAARQRGVSLVALHAWVPDAPADLEAVHGPSTMAEALGRRALERALHRWHPRFPDVPVTTKLVQDEPTRALIAESRGAAMVVIGSRGRGCVRATLLGSVSQSVLQGSHSPLAVIRSLTPGHDTRGTDPTRHESDTPA